MYSVLHVCVCVFVCVMLLKENSEQNYHCIKGANDRRGNYRKLQGALKSQFVFEAKWEETYREATQYKQ